MVNTQKLMELYYEGMISGFCTGRMPEFEIGSLPGVKLIQINRDNLTFVDYYRKELHGDACEVLGGVAILCHSKLLWQMTYGGSFLINHAGFLKKALLENFNKKIWIGGRGPVWFNEGGLYYENKIQEDDFEKSSGEEYIRSSLSDMKAASLKYRCRLIDR